jgi:hypothetical protein
MPCKPKPPKSKKPMSERLDASHKSASKLNVKCLVKNLATSNISKFKPIDRPKEVISAMYKYLSAAKSVEASHKNICLDNMSTLNNKMELIRIKRNKDPNNIFYKHFTKLEKAYAGEISKVVRTQPDLNKLHKEVSRITEIYLREIHKRYKLRNFSSFL